MIVLDVNLPDGNTPFRTRAAAAPSPSRIAKTLEQLDRDCHYQIRVRCLGEARYQITGVCPHYISDYRNELNYGYER